MIISVNVKNVQVKGQEAIFDSYIAIRNTKPASASDLNIITTLPEKVNQIPPRRKRGGCGWACAGYALGGRCLHGAGPARARDLHEGYARETCSRGLTRGLYEGPARGACTRDLHEGPARGI